MIKMRVFSEYNIDGIFKYEVNWFYMFLRLEYRLELNVES